MNVAAARDLSVWDLRLQRALGGRGIASVFQPIIDLRRRTVAGYEALTRFTDIDDQTDTSAPLSPDQWFAAAHDRGVGPQLDAVCIESALRSRADLPRNCFLTINIEPESLLTSEVRNVLAQHAPLGGVVIEITEHRAWSWSELEPIVTRLRASGAQFAVDDAGAGYAGLQQILELRPSILKLDRSIITGIDSDFTKIALVEMLGHFANRIDAWILAEGVETLAEARQLRQLQVPLGQGWLFARAAQPWADIDPAVEHDLAETDLDAGPTLHRLVEPMPTIKPGADLPGDWLGGTAPWVVAVDQHGRPLGIMDPEAAMAGELVNALIANVYSTPHEVAHRVCTSTAEPTTPVIVTDNAGRYLGLITLRRLLHSIASSDTAPPRVG